MPLWARCGFNFAKIESFCRFTQLPICVMACGAKEGHRSWENPSLENGSSGQERIDIASEIYEEAGGQPWSGHLAKPMTFLLSNRKNRFCMTWVVKEALGSNTLLVKVGPSPGHSF
jgi:hypothetical protein